MDIRTSERWRLSVRNAEYCIKNNLPFRCFLCAVPAYKEQIWNERCLAHGIVRNEKLKGDKKNGLD